MTCYNFSQEELTAKATELASKSMPKLKIDIFRHSVVYHGGNIRYSPLNANIDGKLMTLGNVLDIWNIFTRITTKRINLKINNCIDCVYLSFVWCTTMDQSGKLVNNSIMDYMEWLAHVHVNLFGPLGIKEIGGQIEMVDESGRKIVLLSEGGFEKVNIADLYNT